MHKSIFFLFLALALGSQASAQESPPDLARARTAFASADADQSGGVSLSEAMAAGHTQAEFRGFDLDGDGALSHSEFIVGYKERMSAGGRRVASDLENEARRILTQRRAEQADEARRREEAVGQGPAARRSEAMREKIRTSGADPLRVRNQAGTGTDPKSRAAGALRDLQSRRSPAEPPANAPGPNAGTAASSDPARAGAPDTNAPPANAPPANAPPVNAPAVRPTGEMETGANASRPVGQGPAAGRVDPAKRMSPEELQRLFRQRRERAAEESAGDPRVEAERTAEREREREREERAGQSGADARGSTTGSGGAERGSASPSSRTRPASARPRGGG